MNIYQFNPGDTIEDKYTGAHYQVVEPDKNGMSRIRNLATGIVETWNAYNNNRFHKLEGQLSVFSKEVIYL